MLLNVTWNLPWNVSKRLVFRKLLLAHTISYIFPWKLLFTIVVSREWHMKENQQGLFHASSVETACILPSLRKSGVNMARFKVSGNQKFAYFSGKPPHHERAPVILLMDDFTKVSNPFLPSPPKWLTWPLDVCGGVGCGWFYWFSLYWKNFFPNLSGVRNLFPDI